MTYYILIEYIIFLLIFVKSQKSQHFIREKRLFKGEDFRGKNARFDVFNGKGNLKKKKRTKIGEEKFWKNKWKKKARIDDFLQR